MKYFSEIKSEISTSKYQVHKNLSVFSPNAGKHGPETLYLDTYIVLQP